MSKEKRILFRIADIGFIINWTYPTLIIPPDPCYDTFIYKEGIEKIKRELICLATINVHWAKGKNIRLNTKGMQRILSIPRFWALYRNSKYYLMEAFFPRFNRLIGIAKIMPDFQKTDYFILECLECDDEEFRPYYAGNIKKFWLLSSVIYPLIQYLLVNILAKQDGCMVHSAGIKIDNCGLGFFGKSGSGKTTLVKFLRRYKDITVLTDENLVITKREKKYYIQGTPWPGDGRVANVASAPLRNMFFISHGKENVIKSIEPAEAFKKLISQTVLNAWNKSLVNSVMSFVKKLTNEIEFLNLEFVKDKEVVSFIREKLLV